MAYLGLPGSTGPLPGANAGAPPVGAPGVCKKWEIPDEFSLTQSNDWSVTTAYRRSTYSWVVVGNGPGPRMFGTLKLTRFDRSGRNAQVRFTITWRSNSAGIYTGTIDDDGFLTGNTRDKKNPTSRAKFEFAETIDCGRY
jgi:hypothetical protein